LFELTCPLGREAELAAGLTQCPRILSGEAEAELDDVALGLRERVDHLAESLVAVSRGNLLDRLGSLAGQEVAEGGLPVLADGLIQARQTAAQLAQLGDLV